MDLTAEQQTLLIQMVETARNAPTDTRQPFRAIHFNGGQGVIAHPAAGGQTADLNQIIYWGDFLTLLRADMFLVHSQSSDTHVFDLTPAALSAYRQIKEKEQGPVARMESQIRSLLDSAQFMRRHPEAVAKWHAADGLLWQEDAESHLSGIGIACRDAVTAFTGDLVMEFGLSGDDLGPNRTKNRVKAALTAARDRSGETDRELGEALATYTDRVIQHVQKQVHGAEMDGTNKVGWSDAKRTVFQTAFMMLEIDNMVTRQPR